VCKVGKGYKSWQQAKQKKEPKDIQSARSTTKEKISVKDSETKKEMARKEMKTETVTTKKIISEQALLKMPEKDYMNNEQLDFFKARLLHLKEDILKNANVTTENLRENMSCTRPSRSSYD
jgi:DnaK suppressor protein